MTRKRKTGPRLHPEDAALWHHVADSVKARPGKKKKDVDLSALLDGEETRSAVRRRVPLPPPPPPETAIASQATDLSHGDAPGVDKRNAQRLRRGQMPIEARLDLHGHTQEQAHRALNAFLVGSQAAGRRCVLVITGKGLRPGTESTGVLKAAVPRWLNQSPLRQKVLSFSYAQPRDGGEGALYILLRRNR